MSAVVHGRAGQSLQEPDEWTWSGTSSARRGAFFEQRVAQMLHVWLAGRPAEVHVFHDLVGLNNVTGAGCEPISLGGSNIDHLVLTGSTWLMIDAKGCGAGSLQVRQGKGVLVREDGSSTPTAMDGRPQGVLTRWSAVSPDMQGWCRSLGGTASHRLRPPQRPDSTVPLSRERAVVRAQRC